eukprot:171661-Alexandrium_andersonii.AAC.1
MGGGGDPTASAIPVTAGPPPVPAHEGGGSAPASAIPDTDARPPRGASGGALLLEAQRAPGHGGVHGVAPEADGVLLLQ